MAKNKTSTGGGNKSVGVKENKSVNREQRGAVIKESNVSGSNISLSKPHPDPKPPKGGS